MKIIFLDIDGVLNCATTTERDGGYKGIDARLVKLLAQIIDATDAQIVISSTWRKFSGWQETMEEAGIRNIVGATPVLDHLMNERCYEIRAWLHSYKASGNVPETYAILDDDFDFLEGQPIFKTQFHIGLTTEIVEKVIHHLNQK